MEMEMEMDRQGTGTGRAFERERKPILQRLQKSKSLDTDRQAKKGTRSEPGLEAPGVFLCCIFSVSFLGACPCGRVLFVHNGVLQANSPSQAKDMI
jgi:hypothetical protein